MTLWCCTSTKSPSLISLLGLAFFVLIKTLPALHIWPARVRLLTMRTAQIHLSTLIVGNHIDFTVKIITMSAMRKIPLLDALKAVALSPNVVSRRPIFEKYDKNVQGNSYLERGQAASAVILPFNDFPELPADKKAIGVTVGTGGNPNRAKIDARITAEMGICEAALQTSCVGGTWLGATDCLNFGNPEKQNQMSEFVAGVEGVKQACIKLEIPIVSGNVSLYNENNDLAVPPSALVSVFARVDDIEQVKPITWETAGAGIYYLGLERHSLAGSEFSRLFEIEDKALGEVDYEGFETVVSQLKPVLAAEETQAIVPVGAGGVWGTLVGMALNSNQGFSFQTSAEAVATDLMAESLGVIMVSTKPVPGAIYLGETQTESAVNLNIEDGEDLLFDLASIKDEWNHQLRSVF